MSLSARGAARSVGAACGDAVCEELVAPALDAYASVLTSLRACASAGDRGAPACRDVAETGADVEHYWRDVAAHAMQRAAVDAPQWPAPEFRPHPRNPGAGGATEEEGRDDDMTNGGGAMLPPPRDDAMGAINEPETNE